MIEENSFIKHIVETRKIVSQWPKWKRNLLEEADFSVKTLNPINIAKLQSSTNQKK
ncbi:TPA: hypothetical protein ACX6TX_003458 [Yersinia enterocolitica]|uniref:hypothetical protein n=1 Tax=Yersinia enterocolitica TaxID=630 RepID=UPI0021E7B626|nr:hypothetical protein [Yersinia enterocolitica]EKN3600684.1 hypothetical protein [Yersinia enterocolitica]EKN4024426.1 hypothetical protein [Yersinia enterocolitica]EKN4088063.1 hypothetical protein [Yersinia enterocolitica]UYK18847.1 hypothetical protein N4220_00290 [Yersinia enterocolitica]HEN3397811.1 hypothetical protein [Yersinia enterocolitica]